MRGGACVRRRAALLVMTVPHFRSLPGGWKSIDHQAFMERLKKHRYKPTQGFFEHLYHEMTHVARLEIIDHVHWLAEFNYHMEQRSSGTSTHMWKRESSWR
ncbi:unnamed protein product [Effrenium voratum]|nr:unnamed protein product [Effrenium voratum]